MSASSPTLPTLIITGGPRDGQSASLRGPSTELVVGSSPGAGLRLELGNVDPTHARLRWDAQGVTISDAGSASGTYVNGEKVAAGHLLRDGDRIFLGPPGSRQSAKLLVRIPATVAAADDAPALGDPETGAQPLILEDAPIPLVLSTNDGEDTSSLLEPTWATPTVERKPDAKGQDAGDAAPLVLDDPEPAGFVAAPPLVVPAEPAPPLPKPPSPPPPAPKPEKLTAPSPPQKPEGGRGAAGGTPSVVPAMRPEAMSVPAPVAIPPRREPRPRPKPQLSLPKLSLPEIPRAVLLGAALAAALGGGAWLYVAMQQPPPVLASVTPPKAGPGQKVTIQGTGFDPEPSNNVVRFGDVQGAVVSASAQQIVATVPEIAAGGGEAAVRVAVEARGARSNTLALQVAVLPVLDALAPDVAMPGEEVRVTGRNLGGARVRVLVKEQPAEVLEARPNAIRFRVPDLPLAQGSSVPVAVQVAAERSTDLPLLIGRLPLIVSLQPSRAAPGDHVVVRGRGFDPAPGGTRLLFAAQPALVLGGSATELTAAVPAVGAANFAQVPVVVEAKGAASSAEVLFGIVRPAAAGFRPRYFPAPVPEHPSHDHVMVSTELGPLLLLSGQADAPSTAARGDRVAAALNRLMDAAAGGQALDFEARGAPLPAVGVAGRGDVVVTVTPQDAAGYDEPWEGGRPARRTAAQTLAAYWTALLRDHLLLFIRSQRPFHVVGLSSRGRVLSDLYAEASRYGGGGQGIPLGLVSPLSPTRSREMREMALLLPAQASGQGGGAVEGRWEGTMEEGEAGARAIRVVLRVDGDQLAGSLTTAAGQITMDVPLREARYEAGVLRFSAALRGTPKYFVGQVEASAINGTIHADAAARQAVGRFRLRFAQ